MISRMRVRVVSLVVIVVGLFVSFGLAKNLYTAYQNSKILSGEQDKLIGLREENSRLKSEVTQASNPTFVDDEARRKLGLVKPGEVEVIIPNQPQQASGAAHPSASNAQSSVAGAGGGKPISGWSRWWNFLFGG